MLQVHMAEAQDRIVLPARSTRGKRLRAQLDDEENQADTEFWNQEFFAEDARDADYVSEKEEEDVPDSDFFKSESEDDDDDEVEVRAEPKKKTLKPPGAPPSRPRPPKPPAPKALKTPGSGSPGSAAAATAAMDAVPQSVIFEATYQAPTLRKSTRERMEVAQREREQRDQLAKAVRRPQKQGDYRVMTQEELLAEAARTELENLASLKQLLAQEEETKRKANVKKQRFGGPLVKMRSRAVEVLVPPPQPAAAAVSAGLGGLPAVGIGWGANLIDAAMPAAHGASDRTLAAAAAATTAVAAAGLGAAPGADPATVSLVATLDAAAAAPGPVDGVITTASGPVAVIAELAVVEAAGLACRTAAEEANATSALAAAAAAPTQDSTAGTPSAVAPPQAAAAAATSADAAPVSVQQAMPAAAAAGTQAAGAAIAATATTPAATSVVGGEEAAGNGGTCSTAFDIAAAGQSAAAAVTGSEAPLTDKAHTTVDAASQPPDSAALSADAAAASTAEAAAAPAPLTDANAVAPVNLAVTNAAAKVPSMDVAADAGATAAAAAAAGDQPAVEVAAAPAGPVLERFALTTLQCCGMRAPKWLQPQRAPPPVKPICAITGCPAKYKDPLTGHYFASLDAFIELRRRLGAPAPEPQPRDRAEAVAAAASVFGIQLQQQQLQSGLPGGAVIATGGDAGGHALPCWQPQLEQFVAQQMQQEVALASMQRAKSGRGNNSYYEQQATVPDEVAALVVRLSNVVHGAG